MTLLAHSRVIAAIAAAGHALMPAMAHAQQLSTATPIELPFVKLALSLVLCSICALLLALFLKRRMGGLGAPPSLRRPGGWLKTIRQVAILETHRISLNADACRVAFDGKEYLVIVSQGGALLLHERNQSSAAQEPDAAP